MTGKEVTDKDGDILVNYYNNALGDTRQFRNLSAQQKQILYESLIITGGLIAYYYTLAVQQNDPVLQLQAIDLAKSVLKNFVGMKVP